MKHTLLRFSILILCLLSNSVRAQFAENFQSIGGSHSDRVIKIIHDKDDNRYILGVIGMPGTVENFAEYKAETIDFGNLKKEIINGFIAKYNKNNQCVWVKECPRSIRNSYTDFTVDDDGFVYTTGSVRASRFILEKLDQNGNLVWEKNYRSNERFKDFRGSSIAVDKQGNVYVVGSFDGAAIENITFDYNATVNSPYTDYLAKFSPDGKVVWVETSLESNITYTDVLVDSYGNIITAGGFQNQINISGHILINKNLPDEYGAINDRFLVKRDSDNKVIWAKSYPLRINGFPPVVLDAEDNIYLTAPSFYGDTNVTIDNVVVERANKEALIKLDPSGTAKWAIPFQKSTLSLSLLYANQSLYLAGSFSDEFRFGEEVIKGEENRSQDIFLVNINLDGKTLGVKRYGGPYNEISPALSFLPKKKEIILGGTFFQQLPNKDKFLNSNGEGDIFIGQITDTLKYTDRTAKVSGRLYKDKNLNCLIDASEQGFANKLLKIEPGSQFVSSDEQGNFAFELSYGSYTITPLLGPSAQTQLVESCRESAQIIADSLHQKISDLNFGYNIKECYQLAVDIAADRRRRCFRSNTTVTYTNEGTLDAHNVAIKVLYPNYVVPISSEIPWAARVDSALVFNIGTLKAGERRSFVITDSTICGNEGIRGLSQCIKAIITPKNTCNVVSQEWDRASVAVAANYTEQEQVAEFTISNEGEESMSDSTFYRVYANTALVKQGKVKLKKGASTSLELPAKPVTYRLEVDQVPHHPGQSRPAVSLQPPTVPEVLPAIAMPIPINAFYQDDADAEVAISCLEIIDSYDPNDKQVSPTGITSKKYIKAEDELDYFIRFQNTGTDVAYLVVVKDTISEHLDISTLRVGSASHPFTYSVSGKGKPVITFTFKDINLPDDKADEPGSHGYVKFSIAQNPDNPKGTVIRNTAHNYFDYNSPIATNEVINIIGHTILASPVPLVVYDCGHEEPTIAQAGDNIVLCETNQTVLQANVPTKGIGRWKLISGQATIVNPESPTSEVRDIGFGEAVLEWTVTLCKKVSGKQIKIYRNQTPSAPQVAVLPLQCEGDALAPLVATGSNITWYQDAAKQGKIFFGNNYTPSASVTTTFYATQTVNGCESPVKAVIVNINPRKVALSVNTDTLIAPQADSYQWFFDGQPIKGGTSQKFVARNSGQYRLKTITNGCESNSESFIHSINLSKPVLRVVPNPVIGELFVEFASNTTGEVQIFVRNQLGQQVLYFTVQKNYTVLEPTLNMATLVPGMYFLEVLIGKELHRSKFVKL